MASAHLCHWTLRLSGGLKGGLFFRGGDSCNGVRNPLEGVSRGQRSVGFRNRNLGHLEHHPRALVDVANGNAERRRVFDTVRAQLEAEAG